jgi:cytidine diphosphoramidate kinase
VTEGILYWFTGLSGAGKTTFGKKFYLKLKSRKPDVVFLDGDAIRDVLGPSFGFSRDERMETAMRYSRLSLLLVKQGLDVVCCTVSMFHEVRDWNRKNIPHYKEIYIHVPIDLLIDRDQKNLYSKALKGEIKNVVGVDIDAEFPQSPDLTILNDGSQSIDSIIRKLVNLFFVNSS